MIQPNIYCKVCGMAMRCIALFNEEKNELPLVVEIGCADGLGTMRIAGFARKTICIDPMVSSRPDIDSRTKTELVEDEKKVNDFNRRVSEFPVKLIKGCSLWKETLEELKKELNGEKIDVLIIDGCHHPFEAVWGDFETYYPLVSKGGYVVFDDIYEECIDQACQKAKKEFNLVQVSEWSVKNPSILQHCIALKNA